ncbi:hypothetical protein B0I71DRAFT_132812 [Yarrowia lipolytica]|uniref:Pentatricopeptide repeat-containing protein n=1 Tax=Yarrowia lipolytica TaxID=4952 RepID=A0A371C4T1_YARLL|nr:hypothetical protein B0I71DRAFT_132812 [Yarrowia lipolytica]
MLATRVLRNAYTRRMMAELARKGELLGPRPKADPTKKPPRETIKMAPPTDNGREASLFFHTGSRVREQAPTVQVRIALSDADSLLDQLEEVKHKADGAIHKEARARATGPPPKTPRVPALQKRTAAGTVVPETLVSDPVPAFSPHTSIEESGFVELDQMEEDIDTKHTQQAIDTASASETTASETTASETTASAPTVTPTEINMEWQRGIWDRINADSASMADIQNFISDGIKKGYKLTRRYRKGAFTGLYKREEYKTVVQLCKKLHCDNLHTAEFEVILRSAAETNQWRFADQLMNKHWELVEKGPASVSLTALEIFINVDFSIARAFVDQLMHDKRFSDHKTFQEKVAYVYLKGTRTVALNLSEMMRYATQYQDLPFMESDKVLGQMVRGFHQLGTPKQIKIFQQYLCSRGFDKMQGVKEAMFLRYLYLRQFDKAINLVKSKHYYTYKSTISGYLALARRQDWEGVLGFHKKLLTLQPNMKIHDTMNCCLIEAYGATQSMKRAIIQAQSQPKLTPAAVSSLFRVFCHHHPEQSGDLDRVLASPAVSEVRVLTKNLDLRNMVPMMLLNSMDVRNGVSIAAFQGVHIKRRRTIEAMVRQGRAERAYKYYTMLTKTEIPFSEHDYLTLIRGLCRQGFLHLAEEILADFEQAVPQGSWRKRVCRLDVDMLRSTNAGLDSTEKHSGSPRVILADYVSKHCTRKGPRRDGTVLGSPKYNTKTGYEWIVVGMHMVSQGLYVEAREFLKDAQLREPMAYALLAECHARLGDVPEIHKLIKEMRARNVRADQTYKALLSLTEYQYGTGLVAVLDKLKVLIDERHQHAVQDQGEFLEVLVNGVRMHEEKESDTKKLQK